MAKNMMIGSQQRVTLAKAMPAMDTEDKRSLYLAAWRPAVAARIARDWRDEWAMRRQAQSIMRNARAFGVRL